MKRIASATIAFTLLASGQAVAQRSSISCQTAVSSYNTAVDEISTRIRRYTSCLSSSRGTDDCSTEFRRLRSAQSDFETAVSQYRSDCE